MHLRLSTVPPALAPVLVVLGLPAVAAAGRYRIVVEGHDAEGAPARPARWVRVGGEG